MPGRKTFRLPIALKEAFELACEKEASRGFKSDNAVGIGIVAWYCCHHDKPRQFGPALAAMECRDRDLVHSFILYAVRHDISITKLIGNPVRASALLALAKSWWDGAKFRKPLAMLFSLLLPAAFVEIDERRFFCSKVNHTAQGERIYGQT